MESLLSSPDCDALSEYAESPDSWSNESWAEGGMDTESDSPSSPSSPSDGDVPCADMCDGSQGCTQGKPRSLSGHSGEFSDGSHPIEMYEFVQFKECTIQMTMLPWVRAVLYSRVHVAQREEKNVKPISGVHKTYSPPRSICPSSHSPSSTPLPHPARAHRVIKQPPPSLNLPLLTHP